MHGSQAPSITKPMHFPLTSITTHSHSAQVFAVCTEGTTNLAIAARASRRSIRAGKTFTYVVTLRSTAKKVPLELETLALQVVLPEGTRYKKATIFPQPKYSKKHKHGHAYAPEIVNNTVIWPLSLLGGRSKLQFMVHIDTARDLPVASSLTVGAYVYQVSEADVTVCPRYANNVTLMVV